MDLRFSAASWSVVEHAARSLDETPADFIGTACLYLLDQVRTDPDRAALKPPPFAPTGAKQALDVRLNRESWKRLQALADKHSSDVWELAVHAAMLLAADLESGRVAEAVVHGLDSAAD